MKSLYITLLSLLMVVSSFAQSGPSDAPKVAVVSILRGEVDVLLLGKTIKLQKDEWIKEGSVVKTGEKSFVKLVFIDKSQMNIGPNSQIKITKFEGSESGIIDLVKGKIRSQVSKDYLQMKDKDKSKIFIKTPNAVMGIRGTDFMISASDKATSAILFEGSVVFAKNENMRENSTERLEEMVNQGVRIHPGEFSVVEQNRTRPTEPAMLNIEQREILEKSGHFDSERHPGNSGTEKQEAKSVVPEGLSGAAVSNNSNSIKNELASVADASTHKAPPSTENPNGFVDGDKVKPANGSFVHLESGTIIPPGAGSVLDSNTNAYIPGPGQGQVSTTGEYVPPKNVEITSDGKIMIAFKDEAGAIKVQEIQKPIPTVGATTVNLANVAPILADNPGLAQPGLPVSNDILNKNFVPNGLNDMTNLQRNNSGAGTHNDAVMNSKSKVIIIGN